MTSLNRPARLNRTLLTLFGIVLLAAGAFTVLTHFGNLTVLKSDSALVPTAGTPPTGRSTSLPPSRSSSGCSCCGGSSRN